MPAVTRNKKKPKGADHDIDSLMEKRIGLVARKSNDEDSSENGDELNEKDNDSSDEECYKRKAVDKSYHNSQQQTNSTTGRSSDIATGSTSSVVSPPLEEVTMTSDIPLTKNLYVKDRPCIASIDTSYEMYDKIRAAVKYILFSKIKFYRDINDADVFVGWVLHKCGYTLPTMLGKWQHARYWSAVREMIMKFTKDEVQVCINNYYKAVNGKRSCVCWPFFVLFVSHFS